MAYLESYFSPVQQPPQCRQRKPVNLSQVRALLVSSLLAAPHSSYYKGPGQDALITASFCLDCAPCPNALPPGCLQGSLASFSSLLNGHFLKIASLTNLKHTPHLQTPSLVISLLSPSPTCPSVFSLVSDHPTQEVHSRGRVFCS